MLTWRFFHENIIRDVENLMVIWRSHNKSFSKDMTTNLETWIIQWRSDRGDFIRYGDLFWIHEEFNEVIRNHQWFYFKNYLILSNVSLGLFLVFFKLHILFQKLLEVPSKDQTFNLFSRAWHFLVSKLWS